MAHYAEIDSNNIVKRVIVINDSEEPTEETGKLFCQNLLGGNWIKTSYNTHANAHSKNGVPLRANYAGKGFIYDEENDVFYAPQPFPSYALNKKTWTWVPQTETVV